MPAGHPCPPAPGPLEADAAFDDTFGSLARRRGILDCPRGLLLLRERPETLTGLRAPNPSSGPVAAVERLRFCLSESTWHAEAVDARRPEPVLGDPSARQMAWQPGAALQLLGITTL